MLLSKPVGNLRASLLCPCHLPILLALLAGGLGGEAFAGFLGRNLPLILALATGYFVFALWLGQRLLQRQVTLSAPRAGRHDDGCSTPAPPGSAARRDLPGSHPHGGHLSVRVGTPAWRAPHPGNPDEFWRNGPVPRDGRTRRVAHPHPGSITRREHRTDHRRSLPLSRRSTCRTKRAIISSPT